MVVVEGGVTGGGILTQGCFFKVAELVEHNVGVVAESEWQVIRVMPRHERVIVFVPVPRHAVLRICDVMTVVQCTVVRDYPLQVVYQSVF